MSFALKWEADETQAGGFIYFDAVISFTKNYRGQVTKHPIDGGGNITDHFIRENPTFTLSAVFSTTDISILPDSLMDGGGRQPYNTRPAPNKVSVTSTDASVLSKFIPDSIGQFLPEPRPEVVMDDAPKRHWDSLAETLSDLISGNRINLATQMPETTIQEVVLYETNNITLTRALPKDDTSSLVITSIIFKEDVNTGYGLYCDIMFEQVSFVYLKKTDMPKNLGAPVAAKGADKKDKAKQDSTVETDPEDIPGDNDDALRSPMGEEIDRKKFQIGQPLT